MSAYLVSRTHITSLVATAVLGPKGQRSEWFFGQWAPLPDVLGQLLWAENLKSVADRYPGDRSGERPGPAGLTDEEIANYSAPPRRTLARYRLPVVVALKAIDNLEYQSCEHGGWEWSEAAEWLGRLRRALIAQLPGYDEAPWGIDDEPSPAPDAAPSRAPVSPR